MKARIGVAAIDGPRARALALITALATAGCHPRAAAPPPAAPAPRPPSFGASRIRSFSDSLAVTAIADSPTTLFVGTAHGLLRWEGGRSTLLTQKDGLPADRVAAIAVDGSGAVWLATAKGLTRGVRGLWTNYAAAPVGGYLTGVYSDGKTVWAGGPEGLARLRNGRWERFFADTGVTALAAGPGGTLWVGTGGAGVLRILRGGDRVERFGPSQGCDTDVVRGLVAVDKTVFVIGEGQGGQRAAFYDGERFHSYAVAATPPTVLEWAARAGARTLLGAADHIYTLTVEPVDPKAHATAAAPTPAGPVTLTPLPSWIVAPRTLTFKADLPSSALEDPPGSPTPQPPPAPPRPPKGSKNAAGPPTPPSGPIFRVEESPLRLPDGVTTVAGSERGLLVGTRFLGAMRIENDVPRLYRINDLATAAVRLTVACTTGKNAADDCFLATGGTRAWRFDGQGFEVAAVDPEPNSRVLAVLRNGKGDVLAIHRGGEDHQLRLSRVDDGRWTPVGIQAVQVPGAPELNFAEFAPDGHLWVGLRYIDKDGDARDWGADEIALDSGKVIAHKELPTDVVAMFWRAPREAWFATRSGAARLLNGKVRVFTENDGLESELARDIGPGQDGQIFVATGRGTGRFDGTHWTFPRLGAFYPPANALGHDARGHVFIGTEKGLFCVGECPPDGIDARRGLNDDRVHDLAVDGRGRVWVLTEKGINIVEP
jgi:hypothetical protein